MKKFSVLMGRAAYLPIANIDTDMIIPKQYLKTIERSGLGKWAFAEMRYDAQGAPIKNFVLNERPDATILLAGENFGCGSSREHAPWALLDFGLRVVIAPGFADIFYNNAFKNGLLLVKASSKDIASMAQDDAPITVDLEKRSVSWNENAISFAIEENHRKALLEGTDDIEALLAFRDKITAYEERRRTTCPWLFDREGNGR